MLQSIAGSLGVALVVWLPGLVTVRLLRPAGGRLRAIATAPSVSLGLLLTVGLALQAVGLPVRDVTVLPAVVVLVAGLAVAVHGPRRLSGALRVRRWAGVRPRVRELARRRPELIALTVVVVVALTIWLHATHLASAVPANDDGTHHGFFADRILRLHQLDPSVIADGDVQGGGPRLAYYPLALHLCAALVAGAVHVSVGTALDLIVASLAAVSLPVGVFVLTRRLFPGQRVAYVGAAAVVLGFPAFPYYVAYWGGLTMIAGLSLVPALVDGLVGAVDDGPLGRVAVVLGLAVIGVFCLHNPEVVSAALLALLVVLGGPHRLGHARRRLAAVARVWTVAAVVSLVVIGPQLGELRRGALERSTVAHLARVPPRQAVYDAVATFAGVRSPTLIVLTGLTLVGLVAALRSRRCPGWVAGLVVFVVLTYLSARRAALADALTVPWYTRWDRVVLNELVPVATFAGVGAAALTRAGARLLCAVRLRGKGQAAVVVAVVVPVLTLLPQYERATRQLEYAFDAASLAGAPERAAFAYLATQVRPGDRVLNDVTDGSAWMYALDGVDPVFALAVHAFPKGAWGERSYLLKHAAAVGTDKRAWCAADHWHVRFVYIGPRIFPFRAHALDAAALAQSAAWHLIYDKDGARVFERTVIADSPGCPAPAH